MKFKFARVEKPQFPYFSIFRKWELYNTVIILVP